VTAWRVARAGDVPALAELDRACFPAEPWSEAMVLGELQRPGGIAWLAEEGGLVVGAVFAWTILDDLEVMRIGVHPSRRRSGVGRGLLARALSSAPAARQAFLEVRSDNAAAIPFYEAAGWRPISVRRRYYADGCDALILRRSLPPTNPA
jgi:ribosomal-protein-alanine acetyltransferase